MNNIGDRLKLLHTAAGLTQDEVAEKLSMTRQAISSYETGRTQPDLDTIIKMAEIYDTELENIVYGKEPIIQRYEKTKHWAFVLILAVTVLITAGAAL